jgi:hypothetical protein
MFLAKNKRLNEKKSKKNLQVSRKNLNFATDFGVDHSLSSRKNPEIGAVIWRKCG